MYKKRAFFHDSEATWCPLPAITSVAVKLNVSLKKVKAIFYSELSLLLNLPANVEKRVLTEKMPGKHWKYFVVDSCNSLLLYMRDMPSHRSSRWWWPPITAIWNKIFINQTRYGLCVLSAEHKEGGSLHGLWSNYVHLPLENPTMKPFDQKDHALSFNP